MSRPGNNTNYASVCILGDGGVGKTALSIQFCSNHFVECYDPSIEDTYSKDILLNEEVYRVDLLDTAGQEEFSALRDSWIRSCQSFVLVYTVTKRSTLYALEQLVDLVRRVKDVDSIGGGVDGAASELVVHVVGNKCDLENLREVPRAEGEEWAKAHGCTFSEVSAKTRHNLTETFHDVILRTCNVSGKKNAKKNKAREMMMSKCTIL